MQRYVLPVVDLDHLSISPLTRSQNNKSRWLKEHSFPHTSFPLQLSSLRIQPSSSEYSCDLICTVFGLNGCFLRECDHEDGEVFDLCGPWHRPVSSCSAGAQLPVLQGAFFSFARLVTGLSFFRRSSKNTLPACKQGLVERKTEERGRTVLAVWGQEVSKFRKLAMKYQLERLASEPEVPRFRRQRKRT